MLKHLFKWYLRLLRGNIWGFNHLYTGGEDKHRHKLQQLESDRKNNKTTSSFIYCISCSCQSFRISVESSSSSRCSLSILSLRVEHWHPGGQLPLLWYLKKRDKEYRNIKEKTSLMVPVKAKQSALSCICFLILQLTHTNSYSSPSPWTSFCPWWGTSRNWRPQSRKRTKQWLINISQNFMHPHHFMFWKSYLLAPRLVESDP